MITRKDRNTDNVFDRDLIVSLISFLYDQIIIEETRDGNTIDKRVPVFYSHTGQVQFVIDHFQDDDKYASVDCLRVAEGIATRVPSGVMSIQNCRVQEDGVTSGGSRAVYSRIVNTDFGSEMRQFSARTEFIPQDYTFNFEIRCSSDLERMKIRETLVKRFYRARRFYMRHRGFEGLPVMVGFPNDFDLSKDFQYQYPNGEEYPKLGLSLEVRAMLPNPDPASERPVQRKIQSFTQNTKFPQ